MKKIIDDRGRLFGFISFIDAIVLVALVVLALAVFTRFRVGDNPITTTNTVSVSYTVMIPARRLNEAALIRPGDNLYTEFGTYIGKITAVSTADAESAEWITDGTYVMGRVQDRYDVTLIVEAQCSYSDGRYYVDRVFELTANAEQRMSTKYNLFTGYIMSVTTG